MPELKEEREGLRRRLNIDCYGLAVRPDAEERAFSGSSLPAV